MCNCYNHDSSAQNKNKFIKKCTLRWTVELKVKKVKALYLTSVVPSATRLILLEADGAPFTPLPLSVLCFTGIQSYGYTDKRKVETDVEVTEERTGSDLSHRKPHTSQLSHNCSSEFVKLS